MIELGKQYRTRDGREVRIYATDGGTELPVHGAVKLDDDVWSVETWGEDGTWREPWDRSESPFDLIEIRPRIKREYWVNVYEGSVYDYRLFPTKEIANDSVEGHTHRLACVKITIDCEEGEGL